MKIRYIRKIVISLACIVGLSSCAYDDYVTNYDYSAVYFGTQNPVRTLVTRDSSDSVSFKLGVVLGGLLENKTDQWVTFEIAPDLLTNITGASGFTVLPASWYTMEVTDNKIIIPKGKFLGDFKISINKDSLASHPLSLTNNYVLPIRILATSADSIVVGDTENSILPKNYTIVVIKYISENSGTYYVRGTQSEVDALGDTIAGTKKTYYHSDWSINNTRAFTTLSLTATDMAGMGYNTTDKMKVAFGVNKSSVALSTSTSNPTTVVTDLGSTYDATTGLFLFKYTYLKTGKTYKVEEALKIRQDPELDLRFDVW